MCPTVKTSITRVFAIIILRNTWDECPLFNVDRYAIHEDFVYHTQVPLKNELIETSFTNAGRGENAGEGTNYVIYYEVCTHISLFDDVRVEV